ncbi:MAG: ATP-binding protein [Clostridiales bacterium]|jgi:predicted AAA+ superfamily ATPase|nr:ATP-binding protein [Clostridiales bacterium]
MLEKLIQRPEFLEQLKMWREKDMIKVVTGVRRSGKSTLFDLYIDYLKKDGVDDNQIIHINLEEKENEHLLDVDKLYDFLISKLSKHKTTFYFIDEVQMCEGYEKAIDSLFVKKTADIYLTGSNAYMLSGELATLLTGRHIEIDMLPLSFAEYSEKIKTSDVRVRFREFMNNGAFPYTTNIDNSLAHTQYLDGVFSTILRKDVMKRKGITDIALLENIAKFLCSSVGSPVSAKSITDYLISNGRPTAVITVENYIKALCEAYLFYNVQRYNIKGKILLKTESKYYVCDTGLRNVLLGVENEDIGHQLENIVYLELLRRGYDVTIGKAGKKEIDFRAVKDKQIEYYQVSASVLDKNTLARELEPYKYVKDNYPKYLITLDDFTSNYDGIKGLNAIDWLLES